MRSRPVTALLLALAVGLAAAAVVTPPVAAQVGESNGGCSFDQDATVDVLLLLDQSGSLTRTDPNDRRVPGAKAVVTAFASLSERILGVRILVAGFGTDFESSDWTTLTQATAPSVQAEVESFRSRNTDNHTDYAQALHGVTNAFSSSAASCKILYWFTDGQHDLQSRLFGDGLQRSYPVDDPVVVTDDNRDSVMALMPAVVCEDGGYAEQLTAFGVITEVRLLGDGAAMSSDSRRVLQGMSEDPSLDCGAGNGRFASVEDADDLPFELACSSQFGRFPLPSGSIEGGNLTITQADVEGGAIPPQLAEDILVIASGTEGPPTVSRTSLPAFTSNTDDDSALLTVNADLTGEPFNLALTGAARACAFVTGSPPSLQISPEMPTFYQEEPGEFSVVANGPHGRLSGTSLEGFELEVSVGEVSPTDEGWTIVVPAMPITDTFELTATMTVEGLPSVSESEVVQVNEPSSAPRVVSQPQPTEGEGTGPFMIPLDVDGQDGGTLCLASTTAPMSDIDGTQLTAKAALEGEQCVEIPPGANQTITLEIATDRQADSHEILEFETNSTPATGPQRPARGVVAVDLRVLPLVNTFVLTLIVAGILLLLFGLLWAVLYGVNRLVARIPDVRRNKVRYGEFVAELSTGEHGGYTAQLVESPKDTELRVPRADASQLRAGRLSLRRRVSVLPWVPPHAELSLATDLVAARIGSGASQSALIADKKLKTRSRTALGPLITLGISQAQLERLEENPQKVPGVVLFDSRIARGRDASEVVTTLVDDGLMGIAAELSTTERLRKEGTKGT